MDCDLDGQACQALVDTGSNITLVRPGVLRGTKGLLSTVWSTTAVQLKMLMGEWASMEGMEAVRVRVGDQEMVHPGHIQDLCIICLDLARSMCPGPGSPWAQRPLCTTPTWEGELGGTTA